MTARSSNKFEKSPVDAAEYSGLQLDTRAKDNTVPFADESKPQGYLDDDFDNPGNYVNEKQAHLGFPETGDPRSPKSPGQTTLTGSPSPMTPAMPKSIDGVFRSAEVPPAPKERRICGLKKKHFWELFGLVLALIVAAAVVGGVVGGLQANNTNSHPQSPAANASAPAPAANTTTITPVLSADVLQDSPLNVISYDAGGNGSVDSRQTFRIYYQSVIGNIKEAISTGMTSWQAASPIFTDALNGTGLATVTYLNNSQQQGSIFYIGMNGLVQEKRKIFNSTVYWEPGTLNSLNLPAVGNITLPGDSDSDPKNEWGSYTMTAVYSANFTSGAGVRFFYHAEMLNGTSYVQEMVWTQSNDTWTKGAQIPNAWPSSKLAATVDEKNGILRLYFSIGDNTLQEVWTNITDPHWTYQNGFQLQNYLAHNNADLSAVSGNGTTHLYHYADVNQTANVGIHELTITGMPGSFTNQESYNLSEPLVSSPMLITANSVQSPYQPLTAKMTAVPGLSPQSFVFWAERVVGDINSLSGYHALSQTSRMLSNPVWPTTTPLQIPLGNTNSQPSKRSIFLRSLSSLL